MTSRPAQPFAAPKTGPVSARRDRLARAGCRSAISRFACGCGRTLLAQSRRASGLESHARAISSRARTQRREAISGCRARRRKRSKRISKRCTRRDLALALACSLGSAAAWDFFMAQFRPELYRAARAIVGYAAGQRRSRARPGRFALRRFVRPARIGRPPKIALRIFSRAQQAHHVASRRAGAAARGRNSSRAQNRAARGRSRRSNRSEIGVPRAATGTPPPDPERANYLAILQAALAAALGALDPRDRLRLAYYYADDRTLAEIGRLLGEHEATVSRKLERTRRDVRARVEASLRDAKKWSDAQVRAVPGMRERRMAVRFERAAAARWRRIAPAAAGPKQPRARFEVSSRSKDWEEDSSCHWGTKTGRQDKPAADLLRRSARLAGGRARFRRGSVPRSGNSRRVCRARARRGRDRALRAALLPVRALPRAACCHGSRR